MLTINHESQSFNIGYMIQKRQAKGDGKNLTYCFFLEISRDWAEPGILSPKKKIKKLGL